MNGFVSLVTAVAWPLASLAIAALFRRELRLALNRLGQLKYGGVEMTFREDLRQAEALARQIAPPPAGPVPLGPPPAADPSSRVQFEVAIDAALEPVGTLVEHETAGATPVVVAQPTSERRPSATKSAEALARLCRDAPREGILEAWDDLTRATLQAAAARGDRRAPAPVRTDAAARFLVERGWLNGAEGRLIDQLRLLANRVDHREGPPPGSDDAIRFAELVAPLRDRLAALA